MFDKLKKAAQGLINDIGKNVGGQINSNNSNQAYETLRDTRYEYYAAIRSSFGKYEGRIVDLPSDRGAVKDCKSYEETLEKLTANLTAEFELCKKYNQSFPIKTPLEKVKEKYPSHFDWKIITISPKQ